MLFFFTISYTTCRKIQNKYTEMSFEKHIHMTPHYLLNYIFLSTKLKRAIKKEKSNAEPHPSDGEGLGPL